jgi:hypothetical protein
MWRLGVKGFFFQLSNMNFIEFTEWYKKEYGQVTKEEVLQAWIESGFAPASTAHSVERGILVRY